MEIPLRRKYQTAMKGRYKSKHNSGERQGAKRVKLNDAMKRLRHGHQPKKTLLVFAGSGKSRMVNYDDV